MVGTQEKIAMLVDEKVRVRLNNLLDMGEKVLATKYDLGPNIIGDSRVDSQMAYQWVTSVQNLLSGVFGKDSEHYKNFTKQVEKNLTYSPAFRAQGILKAAKDDYEGGYAFSVKTMISGEIYGDFVALAKNALAEGAKDVAAVLACAALEDALKRFALTNGLDVSDKVMQEVVGALKAKGLVGGAQKTLLDTMPKIRDYAMHANWEKITQQDIGSVIGFVEQFLLANFS